MRPRYSRPLGKTNKKKNANDMLSQVPMLIAFDPSPAPGLTDECGGGGQNKCAVDPDLHGSQNPAEMIL